jgi:hypothetical protein
MIYKRIYLTGQGELLDRIGAILEIAHRAIGTDKLLAKHVAGIIFNLVMCDLTMDAIDD